MVLRTIMFVALSTTTRLYCAAPGTLFQMKTGVVVLTVVLGPIGTGAANAARLNDWLVKERSFFPSALTGATYQVNVWPGVNGEEAVNEVPLTLGWLITNLFVLVSTTAR